MGRIGQISQEVKISELNFGAFLCYVSDGFIQICQPPTCCKAPQLSRDAERFPNGRTSPGANTSRLVTFFDGQLQLFGCQESPEGQRHWLLASTTVKTGSSVSSLRSQRSMKSRNTTWDVEKLKTFKYWTQFFIFVSKSGLKRISKSQTNCTKCLPSNISPRQDFFAEETFSPEFQPGTVETSVSGPADQTLQRQQPQNRLTVAAVEWQNRTPHSENNFWSVELDGTPFMILVVTWFCPSTALTTFNESFLLWSYPTATTRTLVVGNGYWDLLGFTGFDRLTGIHMESSEQLKNMEPQCINESPMDISCRKLIVNQQYPLHVKEIFIETVSRVTAVLIGHLMETLQDRGSLKHLAQVPT